MYIAAAPVEACAFVLTFALHRLLVRGHLHRWFWHPALAQARTVHHRLGAAHALAPPVS
jgi:hypothetical protein